MVIRKLFCDVLLIGNAYLHILSITGERSMSRIVLRPLEERDIVWMKTWLYRPHVQKWYEHPESWLDEIRRRDTDFSFIHHKIVLLGNTPIGFCQYYDCFFAQEDWYTVTRPNDTFSIDYLIGETEYLRKGFGTEIITALLAEIHAHTSAARVVVKPEQENAASCKALLAAGFWYEVTAAYYVWP